MRLTIKTILLILVLNFPFYIQSQILIDFQKEIPSDIYRGVSLENDVVYGKVATLKDKAIHLSTESLTLDKNLTFGIWLKPSQLRHTTSTIFGNPGCFNLRLLHNGAIQFQILKGALYDTKCVMDANNWQHIGFSISENMQLRIYYNGTVILNTELSDSLDLSYDNLMLCNDALNSQFSGTFTKVFVSDEALLPYQFKMLYKSTHIAPPLDLGLKAYYPLDGSKKNLLTKTKDIRCTNIDIKADSVRGNVAVFPDEESQMSISRIDYDNQLTIALWAKPSHVELGRSVLLGSKEFTYILNLCDDKQMVFNVPYHFFSKVNVPEIDNSKWNHYAVTVQFNEYAYFYVNGNYIGKCLAMGKSTPEEFWVMGNSIWRDNYMGQMSELFLWNRSLSPEEIKSVYNGQVLHSITMVRSNVSLYFLLFILVIAVIVIYIYRQKKDKNIPTSIVRMDYSKKNAIYLLGEFKAYDKLGNDLSSEFTPRLVQIFALILLFPLRNNQFINSDTISESIWGFADKKRAKSNRNSNISRLKKVLENVEGCEIIYEDKYWRIALDEGCFIDVLSLVNHFEKQDFRRLVSGRFCKQLQQPNFDVLISFFNNLFIDKLQVLIAEAISEKDYRTCIVIADFWMSIDDLSKDALTAKVNALQKLDRLREAETDFEKFSSTYQKVLGEQVNFTLYSLIR